MGSVSDNQIEAILGIGDDIDEIDGESKEERNKRENHERRKNALNKFKKELKEVEQKEKEGDDDEYFLNSAERTLIEMGLSAASIIRDEVETHGKGRDAECLAGIISSVGTLINDKRKDKISKKKLELDRDKLTVKENTTPNLTQNNIFVGTQAELLAAVNAKLDNADESTSTKRPKEEPQDAEYEEIQEEDK